MGQSWCFLVSRAMRKILLMGDRSCVALSEPCLPDKPPRQSNLFLWQRTQASSRYREHAARKWGTSDVITPICFVPDMIAPSWDRL